MRGLNLNPSAVLVLEEPLHRLLQTFVQRNELKVREKPAKLAVGRRLTMDAIALGRVEFHLAIEAHRLNDTEANLLDGRFVALVRAANHRGRSRGDGVQNLEDQAAKVKRVDELPQRRAGTRNSEGRFVLLRQPALVDQRGDDVRLLEMEVVVGTIDVGRHDAAPVVVVGAAVVANLALGHPLRVRVPFVRRMRGPEVDAFLCEGKSAFAGKTHVDRQKITSVIFRAWQQ